MLFLVFIMCFCHDFLEENENNFQLDDASNFQNGV